MPELTKVLVTGGSGYIASYCILQLLQEGVAVRTTIRSLAREAEVRATVGRLGSLEVVAADLNADAGWAEAVAGCDGVLHVASPLPTENPKDDEALIRPARDGALRVLKASRDAGVRRVVMTSSAAAVCYGRGSRTKPYTEEEWSDETNRADSSGYERSKTIAERAAWAWHQSEGGSLELATINPGAVLGPVLGRDYSASVEIVKKLIDGSVPGIPRFGWPLVDVRDIADLHVRALRNPVAAGQRYLGAGEFLWMSEVAALLRAGVPEVAARVPSRVFPSWMVRVAALLDPVIRGRLFELDKERRVDATKARTQLGWVPRAAAESIVDTARSLLKAGVVKPA
jgi:nucleoside-diphosphate-sugar epimerase